MTCFSRSMDVACALILMIASALLSNAVMAVSLGDIQLHSFLDEPLFAEIPLSELDGYRLQELKVSVASPASFQQLGIERPVFLNNLRFSLEKRSEKSGVIIVTTDRVVIEPSLTLLLELRTPISLHTREYTLLFDPIGYNSGVELTLDQSVAKGHNRDQALETINSDKKRSQKKKKGEKSEFVEKKEKEQKEEEQKKEKGSKAVFMSERDHVSVPIALSTLKPFEKGDAYVVRKNDTLWHIADSIEVEGLNTRQIMSALLQYNEGAFVGGNINRLKVGAKLQLPSSEAFKSVADATATAVEKDSKNSGANGSEIGKPELSAKPKMINADSTGNSTEVDPREKSQVVQLGERMNELEVARIEKQLEMFEASQQDGMEAKPDSLLLDQNHRFKLKEMGGIALSSLFWFAIAITPFVWLFGWMNEKRLHAKKSLDLKPHDDISYDDIRQVLEAYHSDQESSVQNEALAA